MAIFRHRDGELRLIEHGYSAATRYIEILFSDANFSGPMGRPQSEEILILDRGLLDDNAHYVEGGDAPRLEPLSLTFSCRTADTKNTQILLQMVSGCTERLVVGGSTYPIRTRKGKSLGLAGFSATTTFPTFKDSSYKMCWMVETLWSGTSNWGIRWDEVYFPPNEQTITESEDALTLNLTGQIYGGVTTITSLSGGIAMV